MAGRSVNKVILLGNLGRDPETRYTTSGVAVSRFSIATSRRVKDAQTGDWKDETDWHNVTLWRNENVLQYLTKGKQVYIEGRLHTRSYEDKDGKKVWATEVVAEDLILVSGGGPGRGGEREETQEAPPRAAPPPSRPQAGAQPPAPGPGPGPDFGPGFAGDDEVPF
jgi:single-strand DNA-binding protein